MDNKDALKEKVQEDEVVCNPLLYAHEMLLPEKPPCLIGFYFVFPSFSHIHTLSLTHIRQQSPVPHLVSYQ